MSENNNPYQPPETIVADPVLSENEILVNPIKNPASHGWHWIKDGFAYFMASPGIWIASIIIMVIIMFLLAFIPILGSFLSNFLTTIFTAGLMLGCSAIDKGEPLSINHLFAGFKKNTGNLVLVSLLYMVGMIVIMLIIGLILVLTGGATGMFAEMAANAQGGAASPEQIQAMMGVGGIAMLVGLAAMIPLAMAYYFAPVLIIKHDLGPMEAMKLSFRGCLKNMIPFLVYGIIMLILAIVASLPVFLGWLVLGPVFIASLYAAYKDIFLDTVNNTSQQSF
jgi:uncharacterized membrane protein